MTERTITIPRRYRGPVSSANGGWFSGRLAREAGGSAEVTLRRPPPIETPLLLVPDGDRILLLDGEALVAEARAADPGLDCPPAPSFDELTGVSQPEGWVTETFGECFSCGRRSEGDGLEIHPVPCVGGVAAPWTAHEVTPETVWAAIDCSGAYAVGGVGRGDPLLARMTGRIDRLPREGERCVVFAWPLAEDGRKLHAGTALLGDGGSLLAISRQLWVIPKG